MSVLAEITERAHVPDEGTATRSHRRRRSGQPKSNTVSKHCILPLQTKNKSEKLFYLSNNRYVNTNRFMCIIFSIMFINITFINFEVTFVFHGYSYFEDAKAT